MARWTSRTRRRASERRGSSCASHSTGRQTDNQSGIDLNVGTDYIDVPVVIDPTLAKRGEVQDTYAGKRIVLREWNEQVLLHELLHVALLRISPLNVVVDDSEDHYVVSRIEVALWETGWRMQSRPAPSPAGNLNEQRALVEWFHRVRSTRCIHPMSGQAWKADCEIDTDAFLASDWLAARDADLTRRAARGALLGAATEARQRGDIGRPGCIEVWDWLEIRADQNYPKESDAR